MSTTTQFIALEPARWPGGPKICPFENLPAFTTLKDAKKFEDSLGVMHVVRTWRCPKCGCVHFIADTNHNTSGTARVLEHAKQRYEREQLKPLEI